LNEAPTDDARDDSALLEKLGCWAKDDDTHWSEWRKAARQSYAFVASDQWSKEERLRLDEAERLPTTINRIGAMVNAVAGAEIIDRQQVQYVPRSVEDSGVNELLTKGAEWIRDQTSADRQESDAFRDALICGLGFTETVMNYDNEPEGRIVIARLDPFEITPDSTARQPNLADGKRIRRRRTIAKTEFEQTYPDATPIEGDGPALGRHSGNSNRGAYKADSTAADYPNDDEVVLTEWQWFEYEVVHVAEHPLTGALTELKPEEFAAIEEETAKSGIEFKAVKQRRKVFWRAVVCGDQVLEYDPMPDGEFTIKAITGERDQNKGTWFGIVEAMKDPQRFANLFFSMLHHIIRTNAKGGILAEMDAFADQTKAEESWAQADAITWMNKGALAQGKVMNKPSPSIPPQISQMMTFAVSGIRDASGINEELLGLVGHQQAGVLEHQRKQAAYAILANYYDSLRAYRKEQGGLLLKYIQKYLPDGYLVRITGDDGVAKYAPLAKQPDTIKFDVIVDDAPAGPNQKAKTWEMLTNAQGLLKDAGPDVWAELIDYSPFPDRVNVKLKQLFQTRAEAAKQPNPMAEAAGKAKIAVDQSTAALKGAQTEQTQAETAITIGTGLLAATTPQPIPAEG
jgi:hypothetical protein